jgi:hypothetical protein
MPAPTTNFVQWNPNQSNQETDSAYQADTLRAGGAATDALFPSATANKLFYQVTTWVTAMAQMMKAKGYTTSDANLTTLQGVLANIRTNADVTGGYGVMAVTAGAASLVPTAGLTQVLNLPSDGSLVTVNLTAAVVSATAAGTRMTLFVRTPGSGLWQTPVFTGAFASDVLTGTRYSVSPSAGVQDELAFTFQGAGAVVTMSPPDMGEAYT